MRGGSTVYKLNEPDIFYDSVGGQGVVINVVTGKYYALYALSTAVVDALIQGVSMEAIGDWVAGMPECPRSMAANTEKFLEVLLEKGILLRSDEESPAPAAQLPDLSLPSTEFNYEIGEFDDMQDLILADPIHDVDGDIGWPAVQK